MRLCDTRQYISLRLQIRIQTVLGRHLNVALEQSSYTSSALALTAGEWYWNAIRLGSLEQGLSGGHLTRSARSGELDTARRQR